MQQSNLEFDIYRAIRTGSFPSNDQPTAPPTQKKYKCTAFFLIILFHLSLILTGMQLKNLFTTIKV